MKLNKADLTVRLLGLLAAAAGACAIWFAGALLYVSIRNWEGWLGLALMVPMAGIPIAYGVYSFVVVIRVWRPLTVRVIRQVTGLLAFVVLVFVSTGIDAALRALVAAPEDILIPLTFLVGGVLAGIFHEKLSRVLVMRSSAAPDKPPLVSKNTVGLICFLLWLTCSSIVDKLVPLQSQGRPSYYYILSHLLGPILLAVIVYKIVIHYAHGLPGLPFIGPPWHRMRQSRLGEARRDRVLKHQCPACAYDVRQTLADGKTACPECGFDLASIDYPDLPAEVA